MPISESEAWVSLHTFHGGVRCESPFCYDKPAPMPKKTFKIRTVPKGGILVRLVEGDQVMSDGQTWWIYSDEAEVVSEANKKNVDSPER